MSRKINFRAWNQEKESFEFLDLIHSHTIMTGLNIPSRGSWDNLKPFQQFVGLVDKNGKGIYEGDIYRDEFSIDDENGIDERIYFVCVFLKQMASFVWVSSDEYNLGMHEGWPEVDELPYCLNEEDCQKISIIGNIYQTPTLLK